MKNISSEEIKDYSKRIGDIIKKSQFEIGIGQIVKMTGISATQIRYWDQKGYIQSEKTNKNKNKQYSYHSLIKIQLIKSFLDSGFTLACAAQKASIFDETGNIIKKMLENRFNGLSVIDNHPAINMGSLSDNENEKVYFIDKGNQTEIKIIKK
ncbi:hypothetical protein FD06_GL001423 [Apilactobacillus ozensis DSM 23829 = JCM 17196]|uniref:HTH merR-type domain-containing protein n=1 Tax=Apilactobacillus ozensis DSM 23829 = JCM 17196 TaxID=1423781 RepID=A0A0R2AM11_9LACO|nr:MerR family transcriptional regulator [Apilactobacillus ozensis]KRM68209.1 hypothetical protein FD06_GL001423 [Apilactobacillus ozensis DSM 23829 = JCM 17196]